MIPIQIIICICIICIFIYLMYRIWQRTDRESKQKEAMLQLGYALSKRKTNEISHNNSNLYN